MSRRPTAALALLATAVLAGLTGAQPGSRVEGGIRGQTEPGAIAGRYIVVLADGSPAADRVEEAASSYARRFGGAVTGSFSTALRGFTIQMSEPAARRLAGQPDVSYVEQDRTVSATDVQTDPGWGLDRIDQRALPLSHSFALGSARTVTAYILDSGIRLTHREFGGRARSGYDFIDNDSDASDCNGHGTHVAATVGGATYGVARDVRLVSVRVLDCQGSASYSQIIAGVNWVARHAAKPAVANMSLGGLGSRALDTAVKNSIAAGVTFVVAGGNAGGDACTQSPARIPAAITVGATTRGDARAAFSNHGACLDLFAPGVSILSAYRGGDRASALMSGTSMAAPHVTGAAALVLAARPRATPRQVHDALIATATPGVVTDAKRNSPTALLYTGVPAAALAAVPAAVPTAAPAASTCGPFSLGQARPIKDRATVELRMTVSGCTGKASSKTTVRIGIRHPDRGDLALTLIAPDGTAFRLKGSTAGDDVANVRKTYTINASAESRRGTWILRIADRHGGAAGTLESFALTL